MGGFEKKSEMADQQKQLSALGHLTTFTGSGVYERGFSKRRVSLDIRRSQISYQNVFLNFILVEGRNS